jgi:hypothetical protein
MFKKTYLSRAMTRAWSLDAPIGDPFGGPAFGERNEPVTAFFAVATAFETIAAIGAVVSVVGMVTGNSDLAKIGGVMGLVGGFGTMAQGGMFGEGMKSWAGEINQSFASSTASNISSAATTADSATMVDGMTSSQVADVSASSAPIATGDLNLAHATSAADTSGMLAPGVEASPTGLVSEPTMQLVDGTAAGATPGASADAVAATNPALDTAATASGEPSLMSRVASPEKTAAAVKAAADGINTGPSLFDKILKFGKENKELSQVALTGIAGMYQSSEKAAALDAQARASNSTANLYDARTAEMQTQAANANAIPTVGGFSVNRNAPIYNKTPVTAAGVRPAGFIQTRA